MPKYRRNRRDPEHVTRMANLWSVFDFEKLKRICEMREDEFAAYLDVAPTVIDEVQREENFYYYQDNGSKILAVAHLDTVVDHDQRTATFANTHDGPVVHSGALDDRLGAYIILDLLPSLGIEFDVLLTVGEESGQSTAEHFVASKEYHWMIEFDRGGTDVVMYQYDDRQVRDLVRDCGADPADGIFSDISYLEHLEIKGFNWGVGYHDYHGPRGYAYLNDTIEMVAYFLKFHEVNADVYLPHEMDQWTKLHQRSTNWWGSGYSSGWDDEHTHAGGEYHCYEKNCDDIDRDPDDFEELSARAFEDDDEDEGSSVTEEPDFIENPTSEQMRAALDEGELRRRFDSISDERMAAENGVSA